MKSNLGAKIGTNKKEEWGNKVDLTGAITNQDGQTMVKTLQKGLESSKQIDALVGYFYFSGFQEISDEVKDKKVRILVGMGIDREVVRNMSREEKKNIDFYQPRRNRGSLRIRTERKEYIEELAEVFNNSEIFDSAREERAFEIFLDKVRDGSLEIRMAPEKKHDKLYILHYKDNVEILGQGRGIVITGSSNLTYSGLLGQGERNRLLPEPHYFKEDSEYFEQEWVKAQDAKLVSQENADEFISQVKEKIWLYTRPEPFLMYMRVLKEFFGFEEPDDGFVTPHQITNKQYSDLKYQIDAIKMGLERIKEYGGVIVADVVGLGKSIIASAIAKNLDLRTVIIAPPHLREQWEDYRLEFNINAEVFSSGSVDKAAKRYMDSNEELLIILDEAHKYRNEENKQYSFLHRLCQGNRVMALSATPFNNDPKDIYALIKLFDTPGQSAIQTVDNLSQEFRELIREYKKISSKSKREKQSSKDRAIEIANELRRMIEPIVIRRSRLDLQEIKAYAEDLKRQKIEFAEVQDPVLLDYELGELSGLYANTLSKIWPKELENADMDLVAGKNFLSCRYRPLEYLKPDSGFFERIAKEAEEDLSAKEVAQELRRAQSNISKFMRTLLVRRFESSVAAFHSTLDKMIHNYEEIIGYATEQGFVPIYKKSDLPSYRELAGLDEDEVNNFFDEFTKNKSNDVRMIKAEELDLERFLKDLNGDIALLNGIKDEWEQIAGDNDPKFDQFVKSIQEALKEDPHRKIVVFSEFADTTNYLYQRCKSQGLNRVFKYTGGDGSSSNKEEVRANFDAGIPEKEQRNDFDVLIATDAISEGFNLHRAGIIVNYDIPYNPTRVIQRVGRINRINRKMFEKLFIYNFFPSATGEEEIHSKSISTLKMSVIHVLMGEDTKTLTSDEELHNYFAKQYRDTDSQFEQLSWDAKHRDIWESYKNSDEVMDEVNKIPTRTRIGRINKEHAGSVLTFGRRGKNAVFSYGRNGESELVSPELAMNLFYADVNEKPDDVSPGFYDQYEVVKEALFKKKIASSTEGARSKRQKAIAKLRALESVVSPTDKDFIKEIRELIKDLDAIPDGVLKEIAALNSNPDKAMEQLEALVPEQYIDDIRKTAERAYGQEEMLVLTEEFIDG